MGTITSPPPTTVSTPRVGRERSHGIGIGIGIGVGSGVGSFVFLQRHDGVHRAAGRADPGGEGP
ncbi:hypothetical protein [Streptomyces rishiriensis]|uniref:hypothetical protein n=1 Tax=Streptomyces rishiriensis TaxID=68264 RepID=UPI0037D000DA